MIPQNHPSPGRAVDRIPVTLLTGFLGAGKTTLLNQLIKRPELAGTALFINEFGAIGIDHHLVEQFDESTVLLDSGCICCNVQGDLVKALKQLSERGSKREIPPVSRVIIETTGLADPVPVIYTLMEERFVAARYVCDGVLTAVDASHALAQLDAHQEAVRQVAMADRLLVTKADLVGSITLQALHERLALLNPGALRVDVRHGMVAPEALFDSGIYSTADKLPDVAAWLGEERDIRRPAAGEARQWRQAQPVHTHRRHTPGISSFVVDFELPVSWYGFAVAMGHILQEHGPRLLRVKGLMNIAGETQPWVIHCVQNVAYPAIKLPKWPPQSPFDDHRGRLVFIIHGLGETGVTAIRDALARLPADAPARRASAASPYLPTRCWLGQRMANAASVMDLEGWVVQPKRLRGMSR